MKMMYLFIHMQDKLLPPPKVVAKQPPYLNIMPLRSIWSFGAIHTLYNLTLTIEKCIVIFNPWQQSWVIKYPD
jgi:hypothetical protein